MNLLEYIAIQLEISGVGTANTDATAGDIFWGNMPDDPDDCICIFSTDSQYDGSPNGARFQVYTRASTTKDAYEKSQQVAEALAEFDGYLAGDGPLAKIEVINASQGMGADITRRELYVSNYRIRYC